MVVPFLPLVASYGRWHRQARATPPSECLASGPMQLPGPSKPGTAGPAKSEAKPSSPGDLNGSDCKVMVPLHVIKAGAGGQNGNSTQSALPAGTHTLTEGAGSGTTRSSVMACHWDPGMDPSQSDVLACGTHHGRRGHGRLDLHSEQGSACFTWHGIQVPREVPRAVQSGGGCAM